MINSKPSPAGGERAAAISENPDERLRPRGSNQIGMRQFNERVVLQAIRLYGELPKAEIARLTHLTPQTISLIIARLEGDGLVLKRAAVRGKVGQPSVPIALDPAGAYSIGIEIGRRGMDVLLVDFVGAVRERSSVSYAFPDPDSLFDEIGARVKELRRGLGPKRGSRLQGIGLAAPLSLGGWRELLSIAPAKAKKWDRIDIRARVAEITGLPVEFVKDTAAACVAELVAGRGRNVRNFLYLFVDTFIGGGLVLDSHLHRGVTGNAGAVGSLAVGTNSGGVPPAQLLSQASLWNLEALYATARLDVSAVTDERALQKPWAKHTQRWMQNAGSPIALAINSAACLLDLEGVIIDGSLNRLVLDRLLAEVEGALDAYNWEGVTRPTVQPGLVGPDARAIGGALLPLYANFAPDRDLFLKLES